MGCVNSKPQLDPGQAAPAKQQAPAPEPAQAEPTALTASPALGGYSAIYKTEAEDNRLQALM